MCQYLHHDAAVPLLPCWLQCRFHHAQSRSCCWCAASAIARPRCQSAYLQVFHRSACGATPRSAASPAARQGHKLLIPISLELKSTTMKWIQRARPTGPGPTHPILKRRKPSSSDMPFWSPRAYLDSCLFRPRSNKRTMPWSVKRARRAGGCNSTCRGWKWGAGGGCF